jgi:hypothetical protein
MQSFPVKWTQLNGQVKATGLRNMRGRLEDDTGNHLLVL